MPLSTQGGVGQDLWILGLMTVGTASILGAINFIVTVLRMRAPGLTMFRLPPFTWATLSTSFLVVLATPVVTAALIMLLSDRRFGTAFFDPAHGGSVAFYLNTFWFFGHPEVYMLILGAWGIVSEIIPVFAGKPLYGYKGLVMAFLTVTALSFTVWAHHMFTTGLVTNLSFFAATTEMISIPTGVLFFVWLSTLWRGKIRFEVPMLFALGFIAMFLIGGIDGVWMASPAMDFAIHDTFWVVAHIHYVLFGGTIFGVFAGIYFWFPKMTGFKLRDGLGKWHFWLMLIGFNLTFFPMHVLGLRGHAAADRALPGRSGLGHAERDLLARLLHHRHLDRDLRRQPVGVASGSSTRSGTTRGRRTPWSGPPPRRRRRTTSTRCRGSAPTAPCTTPGWPRLLRGETT